MVADNEGFLYPVVDESTCIECGLCEKVCHELHPLEERKPLKVLAAINKDEEVRLKSSSGGIFYLLAERVISGGGVVFGARFDEQWQVIIDYAETMEDVKAFMGSKYVQARTGSAYHEAKKFLSEGRKVLFTGTPCQIAGLYHFLRKPYDKLLSVDFICHGTPSPKVWSMYLDEVIREGQRISSVEFRNKKKGWKNFCFNLSYNENDKTISMLSPFTQNHYMKAFLRNIILRPSCYDCKTKSGRSHSDITIADFWGINTIFPDMDDDKGTGLVFINTDKGALSLNMKKMTTAEVDYERVKPLNSACYRSPIAHPKRVDFFNRLDKELSIITLIEEYTRLTFKQRIWGLEIMCKQQMNKLLKIITGGGKHYY